MTRLLIVAVMVLGMSGAVRAQDLLTGVCIITSGSGTPEGSVKGSVCDLYLRSDTGDLYTKQSGTGNTGWTIVPRLAALNVWTAQQEISASEPILYLTATGAGSNLKDWRFDVTGTTFSLQTVNDAKSSVLASLLQFDRSGNATVLGSVTGTAFSGTTGSFSSTVHSGGNFDVASTKFTVAAASGNTAVAGTLGVTGDTTFAANAGTSSFVSQTTGWRVGVGGDADVRSIYTDSLHAKSYIADLEQASAGGTLVTRGVAVIASAFSVPAPGAAVSTITRSGAIATATTSSVHGLSTGDLAYIVGAVQTEYNGLFSVTVTDTTHFTFTVVGTPATPATGTITAAGAALLVVEDLPSAPDMQVFSSGDAVVVRSFSRAGGALIIGDAVGTVLAPDTSASGTQTWTFVRTIATPGSLARATSIAAKSLALDYGVSGNGYIESTAIDGTGLVVSLTRVSTTATVTTSAAHGYKTGDVVYISGAVQTAYNGTQTITVTGATTFTFTVAGSPATPATGTILVDETNGTNAPYVQIVTWVTAPTSDNKTVRTRFGNDRSITGTSEYGLFAGDFANKRYVRFTDQNAEIVGIPLLLYDGSTNTVKIDPTVPSFAMGSTLPSAFGTGTGIWMGKDSGVYKFRVGVVGGNQLSFNGTDLSLTSANLSISSTAVAITPASGSAFSTANGYTFTGNDNYGLGAYNSGTARSLELLNQTSDAIDRLINISASGSAQILMTQPNGGASSLLLRASSISIDSSPSTNTTVSMLGTFSITSSSADVELGSTGASNTPLIDFHSSGNNIDYDARIIASAGSASSGHGTLIVDADRFGVITNGATVDAFDVRSNGGVTVGSPTGGDKGAGTINVQTDIFKNNTAYINPDYVFEHWATGAIVKYAGNEGASTYTGLLPLDDLERYVRAHYRFPMITDRPVGAFGRHDIALALTEQNTLYLFQLNARITALEAAAKGAK